MYTLLKYRKTIGSLLVTLAFVLQWVVTENLEPAQKAAYADTSMEVSEVRQLVYEVLYQQTKYPTMLEAAIQTAATRYMIMHRRKGYDEKTANARFAPIYHAMESKPQSWDEYAREKKLLNAAMGSYWKSEWLTGAHHLTLLADTLKVSSFLLSICGLLLVWSAEAFPTRKRYSDCGAG